MGKRNRPYHHCLPKGRSLKEAIFDNQRRQKYRRLALRLRLMTYEYFDAGKSEKAQRVLDRCVEISKRNAIK